MTTASDKKIQFYSRWIFIASFMVIAIGIYLVLLKTTPLFVVFNKMINPVF